MQLCCLAERQHTALSPSVCNSSHAAQLGARRVAVTGAARCLVCTPQQPLTRPSLAPPLRWRACTRRCAPTCCAASSRMWRRRASNHFVIFKGITTFWGSDSSSWYCLSGVTTVAAGVAWSRGCVCVSRRARLFYTPPNTMLSLPAVPAPQHETLLPDSAPPSFSLTLWLHFIPSPRSPCPPSTRRSCVWA